MRRLLPLAAVLFASLPALAQTPEEVQREREAIPHPVLMDVLDQTVGDKAQESLRLTPYQRNQVMAAHEAFDRQVKEFLRRHPNANSSVEAPIPDRQEVEQRVLAMLNKAQRSSVQSALDEAAQKRVTERTQKSSSTSKNTSTSTSGHSSSSHSSHSSSSQSGSSSGSSSGSGKQSDSSKQSSTQSDRKSDKQSDKQSGKQSDSKSSQQSVRSSDSSSSKQGSRTSWSKLDTNGRRAVLSDLMEQLSQRDRAALKGEIEKR